ncbi:MAG: choline/ethanolamine kinase family protein [Solirubrobacterales bacterium]
MALQLELDAGVPAERRGPARESLEAMGYLSAAEPCRVEVLAGGGSNMNLLLEQGGERYVLRLAEPDVERFSIDRKVGIDAHLRLAETGVAPELCAWLENGDCLTRFVEGPIVTAESVRDPGMLERVADVLAGVHGSGSIDGVYSVFEQQRLWAGTARCEQLALPEDFSHLSEKCDAAEAVFARLDLPAKLCHNDVQLQNFIIGSDRVWLLDFEYAGMGNPYFDLAMVAVNAELGPGEEDRLLGRYFGEVCESDRARVRLLGFMSAMRDATWAVMAKVVQKVDFDYDAWSAEYFGRARRFADSKDFDACLRAAADGA